MPAGNSPVLSGLNFISMASVAHTFEQTPQPMLDAAARHGPRLELARQLGADAVINPARANLPDVLLDLTDGQGADALPDVS